MVGRRVAALFLHPPDVDLDVRAGHLEHLRPPGGAPGEVRLQIQGVGVAGAPGVPGQEPGSGQLDGAEQRHRLGDHHRHKLVHDRAAVKASIHAVLGKCGVIPEIADIFGPVGAKILDGLDLPEPYASRVASQRRILAALSTEITALEIESAHRCKDIGEYRALLTIHGVGPVMGAIFVAEIGDVHRFNSPDQLACWAGLTTRVDSSDKRTRYGHVSKQGSRLLRWAAIEGCQRAREPYLVTKRREIIARRGKGAQHIATVAAARHLMKIVYYTMRDGHARCLDAPPPAAS